MHASRNVGFVVGVVVAVAAACGPGDAGVDETLPRGWNGKADAPGSCRDAAGASLCNGVGAGSCYCDSLCQSYGDCCSDYQAVCQAPGPPQSSSAAIACSDAAAAGICTASPAGAAVYRLYRQSLDDDGQLDGQEMLLLAGFFKDHRGVNAKVKAFLELVLASQAATPDGQQLLSQYLAGAPPNFVPLKNNLYEVSQGADPSSIFDDSIRLKGEGSVSGDTNLVGHSRGYAKKADGILRFAHGSPAPAYPQVSSAQETDTLRTQGPHLALDRAAATYGLQLGQFGFKYLAEKVHYDPAAPYWAGVCHAWSYTAADNRLNALVDVEGPQGRRGIWIFGQWISRADLGNWLMATANSLAIADSQTLDSFVRPENLLKGITQHVMTSGRGLRGDLFNDQEKGGYEVWNQPIYSADLSVSAVSDAVASAVLAHAAQNGPSFPPLPDSPRVKLVRITARWGAEVSDSHEGPAQIATSHWNMYLVTDDQGTVVKGYMAHHLAKAGVPGLPVATSHPLPDYYAFPVHAVVDAALGNEQNALLDNSVDGPYLRFLVGTVLAHGVPDTMRSAFEAELFASSSPDAAALAQKYPGIANAYSPAQWSQVFADLLGPGAAFGARWNKVQP
jgi:hypothetical protein